MSYTLRYTDPSGHYNCEGATSCIEAPTPPPPGEDEGWDRAVSFDPNYSYGDYLTGKNRYEYYLENPDAYIEDRMASTELASYRVSAAYTYGEFALGECLECQLDSRLSYGLAESMYNQGESLSAGNAAGLMDVGGGGVAATIVFFRRKAIRVQNGHLTGSVHPKTGVPFDESGFPDFNGHLYQGGANDVTIVPTGNRSRDFAAANEAAGYTSTPKGFTWHHHQDRGRMQLVDSDVHAKTGHTGGYALW